MGRPKGSKNRSKHTNVDPSEAVTFTITMMVPTKMEVVLHKNVNMHKYVRDNRDEVVRLLKKSKVTNFDDMQMLRYEWD